MLAFGFVYFLHYTFYVLYIGILRCKYSDQYAYRLHSGGCYIIAVYAVQQACRNSRTHPLLGPL